MNNHLVSDFEELKKKTESLWSHSNTNPDIYGFQIQKGTRWLPPHTMEELKQIEGKIKFDLPTDIQSLILLTKELDTPQINLNTNDEKNKYKQEWKLNIEYLNSKWCEELEILKRSGEYDFLKQEVTEFEILPLYAHRYFVIEEDNYKIYSIVGEDIVVYALDIIEYLNKEFLGTAYEIK